jgi:hypothetical protein
MARRHSTFWSTPSPLLRFRVTHPTNTMVCPSISYQVYRFDSGYLPCSPTWLHQSVSCSLQYCFCPIYIHSHFLIYALYRMLHPVFPKVHTATGERELPERFKWVLFELLQDQAQIRPRMLFDGVVNAFSLVELPQQVRILLPSHEL